MEQKVRGHRTTSPTSTSTRGAVIYIRVSDEKQAATDTDGGYSLAVQKKDCRKRAEELGATFVEVFEEPRKSGTTRRRPALDAAMSRANDPDIDWFIVHKASRLARNARDALNLEFELAQSDVQLVAATEAWDESPMGKLMKLLQFGFDQAYSERLRDDVRHKMEEKVRQGGTPYVAPQGYLNVRKNIDGVANVARIEVDDERAEHITWAFKTFAQGNRTVKTLLEELTDRGFTSRPTKKFPERPISPSSLNKLLRNPYYIGIVTWGGKKYPGAHEPLIDVDTFEKVQTVLDGNNTGGDKSWRYRQYLKGTLRCGFCGERMSFLHGRGNGGTYEYFFCRSKQKGTECPQRYIPVWEAEKAVEKYFAIVQTKIDERLPRLQAAFDDLISGYEQHSQAEAKRQQDKIARLRREQKKLLQLSYSDSMPDDLVTEEIERIASDMSRAKSHLEATQIEVGDVKTRFNQMLTLMRTIQVAYEKAPDENRRVMNQFCFAWLGIRNDEIVDHDWGELTEFVLDEQLPQRMYAEALRIEHQAGPEDWGGVLEQVKNEEPDAWMAPGSNVGMLVAVAGFEPAPVGL